MPLPRTVRDASSSHEKGRSRRVPVAEEGGRQSRLAGMEKDAERFAGFDRYLEEIEGRRKRSRFRIVLVTPMIPHSGRAGEGAAWRCSSPAGGLADWPPYACTTPGSRVTVVEAAAEDSARSGADRPVAAPCGRADPPGPGEHPLAEAAVATAELAYCNKFGRPISPAGAWPPDIAGPSTRSTAAGSRCSCSTRRRPGSARSASWSAIG